jgi:3-dehydroquinate dehydratase/shikimate dehydrogenase
MIITSITGPSMRDALSQMRSSERYADLFEFRLDLIRSPSIQTLLSSTSRRAVVTCRPCHEGGRFAGSERERIALLEHASALGASYVDLELCTDPEVIRSFLWRNSRPSVILSKHCVSGPPRDATRLFRQMNEIGADVVKLSYHARDSGDMRMALEFLRLARFHRKRAVALAMGEFGEPTRILYNVWGGWATYAAPESGPPAADGQLPASILRNVYHAEALDRRTRIYGVLGYPVAQSRGIYLHNPLFRLAGRNAVYCRFPAKNLRSFMRSVCPHLRGFSVTLPHKRSILRFLSDADPAVFAIGAANTVLRTPRGLKGFNTDAAGALEAIEDVVTVKGKTMLVIGTGGAARAIAFEGKRRGARVIVAGRTPLHLRAMGRHLIVETIPMEKIRDVDFDILANATPVGMAPHANVSPVPRELLRGKVVFDAVYSPADTRLLREARSVGASTVSGLAMYCGQALRQSVLYTGKRPDRRSAAKTLKAAGVLPSSRSYH